MNRSKGASKSICFLWVTKGYPVYWAESPEEVPAWDVSRGFPLSVGADLIKKVASNEMSEIKLLCSLLRYEPDYSDGAAVWTPSEAPSHAYKHAYPRLVRASFAKRVIGDYRHDEDIIGEIAPLAQYVEGWRVEKPERAQKNKASKESDGIKKTLKNKILKLAKKYGEPHPGHNTLAAWLSLIGRVNVHLKALYDLQIDQFGVQEIPEKLEARRKMIERGIGRSTLGNYVCERELSEVENLIVMAQGRNTARAMRDKVAERLFSTFGNVIADPRYEGHRTSFTPRGVIVECPVDEWIGFKLSELWRNNVIVKRCHGCKVLYIPTRKGNVYCKRGTCADKRWRERQARAEKAEVARQAGGTT